MSPQEVRNASSPIGDLDDPGVFSRLSLFGDDLVQQIKPKTEDPKLFAKNAWRID